jgi:hypothetical protein
MATPPGPLFQLLPTLYRMRDADQGGPLQALLTVMEDQLGQLKDDIAGLYDNWFIETCDEWVVPYIGDLLGVRGQYVFDNNSMSLRPFVANTLDYRRKKGTASMLEGLAADVTGWRARAVEFFQLLATTQNLNHVRAIDQRTPDLRDTSALELLGGPFETTMHFADVRHISQGVGKYNICNVGLFLWRLESFRVDRAPAIPATTVGPGRFRFSQLGSDSILFNPAADRTTRRVVESDMPGALRARAVYDELEAARLSLSGGETPTYAYLDSADPAFEIYADGVAIPPDQIQICDLSDWATLPKAETVPVPIPNAPPPPAPQATTLSAIVSVDPKLGRLVFLDGASPKMTHVTYHSGFSAEIGGGSYARQAGVVPPLTAKTYDVEVVDPTQPIDVGFQQQIAQWLLDKPKDAVFVFRGPATWEDSLGNKPGSGIFAVPNITVPAGASVMLRAVDGSRPLLQLSAPWLITLGDSSSLTMNGLLVAGNTVQLQPAGKVDALVPITVTLEDCTVVPGFSLDASGNPTQLTATSLATTAPSQGTPQLKIVRSIVGRVDVSAGAAGFAPTLTICDSIVDGMGTRTNPASAIITGSDLTLKRVTVLGTVATKTLEACEVIFDQPVTAIRTQVGCVRYCYVPPMSTTPRAYRCQPALALAAATDADETAHILAALVPDYTSRRYGDPGYCQLADDCPVEIGTGAEAGREMGAFQLLMQPQRLANLQLGLDEYLRFGLEAGVFLVT